MDQEFLNILEANEIAKEKVLKSKNLYNDYKVEFEKQCQNLEEKYQKQFEAESLRLQTEYKTECTNLDSFLEKDIEALKETMLHDYQQIKDQEIERIFKELVYE